jgi:hypothetical protein
MLAVKNGHIKVFVELMEAGANFDLQNHVCQNCPYVEVLSV